MNFVALIPGILAIVWLLKKTPQETFISLYLPVLLILPNYYRCMLPGLPDPTMNEAAIIPLFVVWAVKGEKHWKFSVTDFLVLGYAFCVGFSEYLNAGYNEAQNLMVDMICTVVMPYILAKSLIEPHGLREIFAKRVVWLIFIISVTAFYEFKFGATPFRLVLDRFFPGQGEGWVTTFRNGFARIAGPYGHAILAGVIIIIGYRLARWLEWCGAWELQFKKLKWFNKLSKAQLITLGILAGSIMTGCRGPWLGGIAAAVVVALGRTKKRTLGIVLVLSGILFIGVPAAISFWSYASVGRANAKSDSQETAAYRKELMDKYIDIAIERSVWGWGRNTYPKVSGMPSIDNYFLLLSLMHGLIALGFLVGLFLWMFVRLLKRGFSLPPSVPAGSSLAFTLAGIYLAIFISIATVYMGEQVVHLLFILSGWAEAYLQSKKEGLGRNDENNLSNVPLATNYFNFRRVLT